MKMHITFLSFFKKQVLFFEILVKEEYNIIKGWLYNDYKRKITNFKEIDERK